MIKFPWIWEDFASFMIPKYSKMISLKMISNYLKSFYLTLLKLLT